MTEHYFGEVCGSRGCTVSFSCINTKSADVKVLLTSSNFLPVPSRPPCRSASHHFQLCRLKGLQSRAPVQATSFRTPVLMRIKCMVSMPTGMHHAMASHEPAEQHYLAVHRQLREYIIPSLHSDLDGKFLHPPIAQCQIKVHISCWVVRYSLISIANHVTWYCLTECAQSKLDSHKRLHPTLPRQAMMKDNRLCINQRDGAFWSRSQLD